MPRRIRCPSRWNRHPRLHPRNVTAAAALTVPRSQAADIYFTDFEEFNVGPDEWAGTNGWSGNSTGVGVHGIDLDMVPALDKTAFPGGSRLAGIRFSNEPLTFGIWREQNAGHNNRRCHMKGITLVTAAMLAGLFMVGQAEAGDRSFGDGVLPSASLALRPPRGGAALLLLPQFAYLSAIPGWLVNRLRYGRLARTR